MALISNKKKILIYDDQLSGHHLEYIHHLHEGASEIKDIDFIFAVPYNFNEVKSKLNWSESENTKYHYISKKETEVTGNIFTRAYRRSKSLKRIALKYSVNEVFLISIMSFMPVITFILSKKIKINGIIYLIYLYRWKNSKLIVKIIDSIKYLLLSKIKQFKNLYILNDESASIYLNKKFQTSKFIYLPDPIIPLPSNKIENLRPKLKIPIENRIILHFGAISERKGSLNILRALSKINLEYHINTTIIFAGVVDQLIKYEFYELINSLDKRVQIIIFDKFCDFEFIASLCYTCDYILIPYLNTNQSSGVLGYANQFKKPVVCPRHGLLGKLVRKHKLGILLPDSSVESITYFFCNSLNKEYVYKFSDYSDKKCIEEFTKIIFNKFYEI